MQKSADAFRTISEVSELLDIPAHVLRFWESRFAQIKPVKRAGGRRYYRPGDVALLRGVKRLLYDDGLTIRGVQKILREKGVGHVAGLVSVPDDTAAAPAAPRAAAGADRWPAATDPDAATDGVVLLHDPDDAGFEPAPDAAAGHWPVSPAPEVPAPSAALLPDPDDEAPMIVDAPALPPKGSGIVTALDRSRSSGQRPAPPPRPAAPPPPADEPDFPAAGLLRAMDAMRAREKRDDLAPLYHRMERLDARLSRATDAAAG